MTVVDNCGWCRHIREKIDGWKPACDAFPEGIDFDLTKRTGKDCANGIHFEVDPEKAEMYERCWGTLLQKDKG